MLSTTFSMRGICMRVLVAELLGHLLAHHLLVVRLHARLVVLRPRGARGLPPSVAPCRLDRPCPWARLSRPWRPYRAWLCRQPWPPWRACRHPDRLFRLSLALPALSSSAMAISFLQSLRRSAWRRAPCARRRRILKPTSRRLAVLGILERQVRQVDRRLLGDDAAFLRCRLALMPAHHVDAAHQRAALLAASPGTPRPSCPCRGRRARSPGHPS